MTITRNIATFEQHLEVIKAGLEKRSKYALENLGNINPNDFILTDHEIDEMRKSYEGHLRLIEMYVPEQHEGKEIEVSVPVCYDDPYLYSNGYTTQIVCHGAVSDLTKPVTNAVNWYLQNTSQWLFGFGIVFDVRRHDFRMHT